MLTIDGLLCVSDVCTLFINVDNWWRCCCVWVMYVPAMQDSSASPSWDWGTIQQEDVRHPNGTPRSRVVPTAIPGSPSEVVLEAVAEFRTDSKSVRDEHSTRPWNASGERSKRRRRRHPFDQRRRSTCPVQGRTSVHLQGQQSLWISFTSCVLEICSAEFYKKLCRLGHWSRFYTSERSASEFVLLNPLCKTTLAIDLWIMIHLIF